MRTEESGVVVPILLTLIAIVGYGVYSTYLAPFMGG